MPAKKTVTKKSAAKPSVSKAEHDALAARVDRLENALEVQLSVRLEDESA